MTDRPTPEQAILDSLRESQPQGVGIKTQRVIDALQQHGYVIVHPDDYFLCDIDHVDVDYESGWRSLYNEIFDDDQ